MLNFTNSKTTQISIHFVGNKLRDEQLVLSNRLVELDQPLSALLTNYFLSPFKNIEYYCFYHESELEMNNIYSFIKRIFNSSESFFETSKKIAKHLYEHSTHPKISGGNVYLTYFKNCILDNDEVCDAIGIFKSESNEVFLKINPTTDGNFQIKTEEGININKIDKGCLIFNTSESSGYKLCIIDSLARSEAQYWKNDFLKLKSFEDSFHFTQNFLSVAKEFVTKQMPEEYEVTKTDQIDFLNRSVNFFKENSHFDENKFSKEVFENNDLIKSFKNFKNSQEQTPVNETSFEISKQAVKKQSKVIKRTLKLDKNFDIHIHNNVDLIENGIEKDGRKYYKIYYEKET